MIIILLIGRLITIFLSKKFWFASATLRGSLNSFFLSSSSRFSLFSSSYSSISCLVFYRFCSYSALWIFTTSLRLFLIRSFLFYSSSFSCFSFIFFFCSSSRNCWCFFNILSCVSFFAASLIVSKSASSLARIFDTDSSF